MVDATANLFTPFSLLSCILFTIFVVKWVFGNVTGNHKNLPPSPPKLPVLGNLLQLGLYPHRSLQNLAQRYGSLMLLHLGSAPTLVVSSADAARQIFKSHDLVFSNRPSSEVSRKLLYNYRDLAFSPYGEYWRRMRSICMLQLLSTKRVQSFRFVREEEAILLVKKIGESSSPIDLCALFASLTTDLICRVAFGRKYSEGDDGQKFKKLLEEFGALLGVFNIADFVPWLAWINNFSNLNARVDKVFKEIDQFLEEILNDHMKRCREDTKEDEEDFVDVLLDIDKNGSGDASIGRDSIKALILDMFAGGSDTTYTALEWTMTEVLRHPEVMKKAQEEIRSVCGNKPIVTEEDLDKIFYLKAIINESMRLHPPLPLLIPRESREDVRVQGYDILAGTRVIVNAWAIGRDSTTWEDAEQFRPDRFLGSSIDLKGHDFQLFPFGAGRRGCPGITFATATMEITLANCLHVFDWALPDGLKAEDLNVTETLGLAVHRKIPLVAVATPHSF